MASAPDLHKENLAFPDLAGVILLVLNERGEIIRINREGCTILGYSEAELIGKNWFDLVVPGSAREDVRKVFRGYLAGEREPREYNENPVLTKTGEERLISWHNAFLRDEAGCIVGTLSSGEDITERRKMEEALRRSEEKYRGIFENAVVGIFQTSPEGRLLRINQAFAQIFGYDDPEQMRTAVFNADLQLYAHTEEREKFTGHLLERGMIESSDFLAIHRTGKHFWVTITARAVKDSSSAPLYYEGTCVDITERKKAEGSLRKSEERFRRISQMMSDFAFSCTKAPGGSFHIDWMTGAVKQITGYSIEEVRAWGCWRPMVFDEDKPIFQDHVIGLHPGQSRVCELRILHQQGGLRWLRVYSEAAIDPDDPLVHRLYGACQDITERKQAEEALRVALTKYRVLFESLPLGVTITDREGKILESNQEAQRLLGLSLEELRKRKINGPEWHLIRLDGSLIPLDEYTSNKVLRTHQMIANEETGLVRKNGEVIWLNTTVAPIPLEGLGVALTLSDISESRKMEAELRSSEERYRRLFEAAQDSILILDAKTGEIVDANPFLCKLTGYPLEEIKGKKVWELGATRDIFENKVQFSALQRDGFVRFEDLPLQTAEGRSTEVEFISNTYQVGEQQVIQCNIRDISQRKQLERTLEKARTDFLFAVSHELKTPIHILTSMVELIETMPPEQQTSFFVDNGNLWKRNLLRLRHIIDNLVDSQRPTNLGLKLSEQPQEIACLIQDILEELAPYALSMNISFHQDLDSVPSLSLDLHAISRLLENLLTNAIKFSHRGGHVEIRLWREGGDAVLAIQDHGMGIDLKALPHLGQPFYRSPEAMEAGVQGTGLGLYVAKMIAEAHGGSLRIDSELGRGTSVTVRLPLERK